MYHFQKDKESVDTTVLDILMRMQGNQHKGRVCAIKIEPQHHIIDCFLQDPTFKIHRLPIKRIKLKAVIQSAQPTLSLQTFRIVREIGRGTFARVYLAEQRHDGKMVAIKCINRSDLFDKADIERLSHEVELMIKLPRSTFLNKILYFFQDWCNSYIVTEYHPLGDLYSWLHGPKKITKQIAAAYFIQMVHALSAVHRQNYVYRDVKAENVLVGRDGCIKLADFGYAEPMKGGMVTGFCGSFEYMAPEMLKFQPYSMSYDVYSLGILLYELVVGKTPFDGANKNNIMQLHQKGIIFPADMEPLLVDLITRMTDREPTKRLGAKDIRQCLEHQWLETVKTSLIDVDSFLKSIPWKQQQIAIKDTQNIKIPQGNPKAIKPIGIEYNHLTASSKQKQTTNLGPKLNAIHWNRNGQHSL